MKPPRINYLRLAIDFFAIFYPYVLEFLLKCTVHLMNALSRYNPPSLNTYKMGYEDNMKKALAEVESCSKLNYSEIAEKYSLVRTTLSRRARGKTTS
jgi:hypothetical protein